MENRKKRCSVPDGARSVSFDIFMDTYFTSFRLLTLLGATILEQHMCSTKVGYAIALSLGTNSCKKERNVATLNSAPQPKNSVTLTVAG